MSTQKKKKKNGTILVLDYRAFDVSSWQGLISLQETYFFQRPSKQPSPRSTDRARSNRSNSPDIIKIKTPPPYPLSLPRVHRVQHIYSNSSGYTDTIFCSIPAYVEDRGRRNRRKEMSIEIRDHKSRISGARRERSHATLDFLASIYRFESIDLRLIYRILYVPSDKALYVAGVKGGDEGGGTGFMTAPVIFPCFSSVPTIPCTDLLVTRSSTILD